MLANSRKSSAVDGGVGAWMDGDRRGNGGCELYDWHGARMVSAVWLTYVAVAVHEVDDDYATGWVDEWRSVRWCTLLQWFAIASDHCCPWHGLTIETAARVVV